MEAGDGLSYFKSLPDWKMTLEIEEDAQRVLALLATQGNKPTAPTRDSAKKLLISIEAWKASCMEERMGNAERNSAEAVWNALLGAVNARTDREVLLSVMNLVGFGSSVDTETGLRRAKVASSVPRFLFPTHWGVVDWRNAAMRIALDNSRGDVDLALAWARKQNPNELRRLLDVMDEAAALELNEWYRSRRTNNLSRAADVDMALFGLSLMAWPMRQTKLA